MAINSIVSSELDNAGSGLMKKIADNHIFTRQLNDKMKALCPGY